MTFNIASFLTFALALPSLDAVTAVSVPKSLDGGDLNKRDPQNVFVKFFDVPEGGLWVFCYLIMLCQALIQPLILASLHVGISSPLMTPSWVVFIFF